MEGLLRFADHTLTGISSDLRRFEGQQDTPLRIVVQAGDGSRRQPAGSRQPGVRLGDVGQVESSACLLLRAHCLTLRFVSLSCCEDSEDRCDGRRRA